MPDILLKRFPPSPYGLLDAAREGLDDSMLWDIAMADYGCGAQEAFDDLVAIGESGLTPQCVPWILSEVLCLTRWRTPERPNPPSFQPGPTGVRGHRVRLFACAVLICIDFESSSGPYDTSPDSTLARGLESVGVLGEKYEEALGCFLTWRFPKTDERLFYAVSLLVLAMRSQSNRMAPSEVGILADWVLGEERACGLTTSAYDPNPMPSSFSMMQGFWKAGAAELRAKAAENTDPQVREKVLLCALLLDPT